MNYGYGGASPTRGRNRNSMRMLTVLMAAAAVVGMGFTAPPAQADVDNYELNPHASTIDGQTDAVATGNDLIGHAPSVGAFGTTYVTPDLNAVTTTGEHVAETDLLLIDYGAVGADENMVLNTSQANAGSGERRSSVTHVDPMSNTGEMFGNGENLTASHRDHGLESRRCGTCSRDSHTVMKNSFDGDGQYMGNGNAAARGSPVSSRSSGDARVNPGG